MDFFNSFDIDASGYFNLASPSLKGAVGGGLVQWLLGGGIAQFSADWKKGINGVLVRGVSSALVGFPIQFLIDLAPFEFVRNYRMLVTAGLTFFIVPWFSSLEQSLGNVTYRFFAMIPF